MKVALLLLLIGVSLSCANNLFDTDDDTIISPNLQAVTREEEELIIDESLDDDDSDDGDDEEEVNPNLSQKKSEEEAKSIDEETMETVDDEEGDYEDDEDDDDEEDIDREFPEAQEEKASDYEDETDDEEEDVQETDKTNMCEDVICKRGKECVIIDEEPQCRCILECPTPLDLEDRVCGTDNSTYVTECELWRTRCLYKRDNVTAGKHLRLSYYGPCKKLYRCSDDEMFEFPTRMRVWIKNVFLQLYDEQKTDAEGLSDKQKNQGRRLASNRNRLREYELKSIQDMKNDVNNGVYMTLYRYPVHWKFLVLDVNPPDKYLSRNELEPLLATLIPLEPCTRKFFKEADADRDHRISLYEWGMSLGLKQEDMDLTIEI